MIEKTLFALAVIFVIWRAGRQIVRWIVWGE